MCELKTVKSKKTTPHTSSSRPKIPKSLFPNELENVKLVLYFVRLAIFG